MQQRTKTTDSMSTGSISSLRDIARSLSTAINLDTNLDLIVRKTTEVMGVDSCTLYLLESDDVTLRLRASTGLRKRMVGRASLHLSEGMTGKAVVTNRPIYAADARNHPDFKYVDYTTESELRSLLAVPLVLSERPIGAMNVQTADVHAYSSAEIETLQLISELAAGALTKARLYDQQKTEIEELRALSEAVKSPQMFDDMLHIVTDMAARTMNASVCAIFLLDETSERLELRSAQRINRDYKARMPIPIDEGVIGSVVRTGQIEYVSNILDEPRFANKRLAAEEGLVSMLAVPLSVRDKVIGVLVCYTGEHSEFDEKQRALFSTLANQTALAIENSRLATNAAVVREMHHRIKNNLQTVAMLMQLQIPDAERLNTREVLETNIHRIRSIATVHEVLSEKGFHLVDVRDVLQRIAHATIQAVNLPQRAVAIDVRGDALLMNSHAATALALIVNELVQNAVEHAFVDRTQGSVLVSIGRTAESIYVSVRDDGVGVPAEVEYGLGLEIASTLVIEDLDGTIAFNRLEQGSEIVLTLPRSLESNLN